MADINSSVIESLNGDPLVKINPPEGGSQVSLIGSRVSVAGTDNDGDVLRFVRVRSTDKLISIRAYFDVITGFIDGDCGLYEPNDGPVVDADLYSSTVAFTINAPGIPPARDNGHPVELRVGDVVTAPITAIGQAVWEDLGLPEDPFLLYDLCITANTIGTGSGDIGILVHYVPTA